MQNSIQHRRPSIGEYKRRATSEDNSSMAPLSDSYQSNNVSLVLLLEGSSYLVSVIAALLKWRMSFYTAGNGFAGPSQQAHCPRVSVLHSGRPSHHMAISVRRRVYGVHIGCIANFTDGSSAPHAPLKSLFRSCLHVTWAVPLLPASGCGALKMMTFRLTRLCHSFLP